MLVVQLVSDLLACLDGKMLRIKMLHPVCDRHKALAPLICLIVSMVDTGSMLYSGVPIFDVPLATP